MTQSTSHASSSYGSDSSNVTQYTPNTGMYMGQFPWPKPAYIPNPGYAPAHPHGTAPPYAPVAPSPGVGPEVAHHAFQVGQNGHYPPAAANVSHAAYFGPHPQHPSAPPLYNQPLPSSSFPGATTHYTGHGAHQNYPPTTSQQAYLDQPHGAGLATGSASTSLLVSKKRAGEEHVADDRKVKRRKVGAKNPDFGTALEIEDAALVEPMFPPSQVREITLAEVSGDLDFWRWINDIEDPADPAPPLSDSPLSPSLDTLVTEATEDTQDPDFWAANEIKDPVLVEPVLPPSQAREITLAEAGGDLDFWRWINDIEDPVLVEPVLPPFQVREITLAEAGGDLDFWRWINDIEDPADPAPPLSDSPVSPSLEILATDDTEEDLYSWMSKHDIVIPEPVEDPEFWMFHPGREHPAFLYNVDPFAVEEYPSYLTEPFAPSSPILVNHEM